MSILNTHDGRVLKSHTLARARSISGIRLWLLVMLVIAYGSWAYSQGVGGLSPWAWASPDAVGLMVNDLRPPSLADLHAGARGR